MRKIINIFFCLLTVFLLQSSSSLACTLPFKPLSGFDSKEYVFTGKVIGFVNSLETGRFRRKASGLKVKVDDAVYLPKKPADYFEVIPYDLRADCSVAGISLKEISAEFPLNSKVKVIAKEAEILKSTLNGGNIRLEILPGSKGDISKNYFEDGKLMTSAKSIFDYEAFQEITPTDKSTKSFTQFLEAHLSLPDFELRKDFLRLNDAKTETERIAILKRLVYYPDCCIFDFNKLVREYVKDTKVQESLLADREKWNKRDGI